MDKLISITDATTGENLVRKMNKEELAHLDQMIAEAAAAEAEKASLAIAKAEVLNRLGITADEAALLLS